MSRRWPGMPRWLWYKSFVKISANNRSVRVGTIIYEHLTMGQRFNIGRFSVLATEFSLFYRKSLRRTHKRQGDAVASGCFIHNRVGQYLSGVATGGSKLGGKWFMKQMSMSSQKHFGFSPWFLAEMRCMLYKDVGRGKPEANA